MDLSIRNIIKKAALLIYPSCARDLIYHEIKHLSWQHLPDEEVELLLLEFLLEKEDVFFDVGANAGNYIYQAGRFIPENQIVAFEPIPYYYNNLKRSFKNAKVYELALAENNQTGAAFKIPYIQNKKVATRGTLRLSFKEPGEDHAEIIKVDVSRLDSFVDKHQTEKIDFIKVDVEGYEFEVIKGGLEAIKKFMPLMQIEIEQRHHQQPAGEIIHFIMQLGYQCYYFDPNNKAFTLMQTDPGSLQQPTDFKTLNYINNFYFFPQKKYDNKKIDNINELISQRIRSEG